MGLNTRLLKTQLGGLFDIGDIRRNRSFELGTCQEFLDLDPCFVELQDRAFLA